MLTLKEIRADLVSRLTGASLTWRETFKGALNTYPTMNTVEAGMFVREFENLQIEGIVVQPISWDHYTIVMPK